MIYQLGNHILIQGDCMNIDLTQGLGENKIRMILTDPPYGVAYVENKMHTTSNQTVIQNDQLQTEEEYGSFTQKWLDSVKKWLDSYNSAYIFNSDLMMCALRGGVQSRRILLQPNNHMGQKQRSGRQKRLSATARANFIRLVWEA